MSTLQRSTDESSETWSIKVYPGAREAWAMRPSLPQSRRKTPALSSVLDIGTQLDGATQRLQVRDERSVRRSRSQIRRYAVENRLDILVTPTYAPEHLDRAVDRKCVELDIRNLVRRARAEWDQRFPYISMPEIQPERSEALEEHVYNGMLLVPRMPMGVFRKVIDSWPYGRGDGYNGVDVTEWSDDRGGAKYATKAFSASASAYASKSLGSAEVPPGGQLYRVAQGFQPKADLVAFRGDLSAIEALEVVTEHYGASGGLLRASDDDSWVGAWSIW